MSTRPSNWFPLILTPKERVKLLRPQVPWAWLEAHEEKIMAIIPGNPTLSVMYEMNRGLTPAEIRHAIDRVPHSVHHLSDVEWLALAANMWLNENTDERALCAQEMPTEEQKKHWASLMADAMVSEPPGPPPSSVLAEELGSVLKIGPGTLGVVPHRWRLYVDGHGVVHLQGGYDGITWHGYAKFNPEPNTIMQWELIGQLYPIDH